MPLGRVDDDIAPGVMDDLAGRPVVVSDRDGRFGTDQELRAAGMSSRPHRQVADRVSVGPRNGLVGGRQDDDKAPRVDDDLSAEVRASDTAAQEVAGPFAFARTAATLALAHLESGVSMR